jgi:hypothetical protein
MQKPCVIVIEYTTRENLKEVARKSQRYTDIINELILLKQNQKENSNVK